MSDYDINKYSREGIDLDKATTRAIVGHMFRDRSFADRCRGKLKPNQFPGILSEIVAAVFDLCGNEKYTHLIFSKDIVLQHICYSNTKIQDQFKYANEMAECERFADTSPLEVVSDYLEGWLTKIIAIEQVQNLADQINKSKYKDIKPSIIKMHDIVQDIVFVNKENSTNNFKNLYESYLKQDQQKAESGCTIGHPSFDELLVTGSLLDGADKFNINQHNPTEHGQMFIGEQLTKLTRGGLLCGGNTIILGTANSGKTTTICTIGGTNAMMAKDVLLITLEQSGEEIRDKLVSNIMGLSNQEIRQRAKAIALAGGPEIASKNPNARDFLLKINAVEQVLLKHVVHVHHNKTNQMNLEFVLQLLNQEFHKRKKETGKSFDLVIIDYPGRLRSDKYLGKTSNRHEELWYIYQTFIDHAREFKYHTILPVQTNREGYRVNQGDRGRLVDMGDTGGAFAIAQAADQVITINRSSEDKTSNRIRYLIAKNRSGATESVFMSETDMARSQAFGLNMRSVVFNNTSEVDSEYLARMMGESQKLGRTVYAAEKLNFDMAEKLAEAKKQQFEAYDQKIAEIDKQNTDNPPSDKI